MIVLAICGTIAAVVWTVMTVLANGMSDAPSLGFQGADGIVLSWVCVAVLWVAWWFG